MSDERAQLRTKAEACRRLADLSKNAERKAFWLDRAGYWKRLATNIVKQPQPRYPAYGRRR
jgi:hypothetical protein